MPTNPTTPTTSASVDRLTLGSEVVRGTVPGQASCLACACLPNCFDAEASVNVMAMNCMCFDTESSAAVPGPFPGPCGYCFESSPSGFAALCTPPVCALCSDAE